MTEFIVYCLPTLVYVVVQTRRRGGVAVALSRAGISWGARADFGRAVLLLVPLVLTGWLAIVLVPAEVLDLPGVTIAQLTSVGAVIGVVLRAVGEEVFFRGLLGGVFMRRLGAGWGNLLQAAVFLVPHLVLLMVDVRLWPVLPVQFAAGWLLGWLRYKSDSFVPGAVVHVFANIAAGMIVP